MKIRTLFLTLLALFLLSPASWAAQYNLDQAHTTVGFKIKHLISWVQGSFNEFEGSFNYDPNHPETWSVEATIKTASIDTGNEKRDNHLRTKDFFDAETYPVITFKSTGVSDVTPTGAQLSGILSMHGVEKPVTLNLEILGIAHDPWGNTLSAFTATTQINRKDFGLNWNEVLDNGGLLVGEEVLITLEVSGLEVKG